MSSQMIQIVILAGVALFLVLQLRRVLGTREGFENDVEPRNPVANGAGDKRDFEVIEGGGVDYDVADFADIESDTGKALLAMKAIEPGFSVKEFTGGSRQAYEMILMAFENGDLDTLNDFLSPDVYNSFAAAVEDRSNKGLTVDANFIGVREIKLLDAAFDAETKEAEISMKFIGELTSVVTDAAGNVVEGDSQEIKRQRDTWTFARLMGTNNPNWLLVATER